ncbi:MAG: hypothetical protein EBR81_12425 [Proteobacteria bacterium]|nr:hypothetical protein [Pseudomonadota bacterium]
MLNTLSRETCWLVIWIVLGLVFSPAAQIRADEIPAEVQSSLASPETLDIYSVTSEGVLEKLR